MVVALLGVELVDEEDDRLAQFLGVAEVVLCAHFGSILSVDEQQGRVSHMQGCHGSTHKVVGTGAVDDVQFLSVPFHMKNRGEDTVAILLLYRKIVAHRVLGSDATTTADDASLIQECFGKGSLTGTVIAKQGNVLDFVGLVNFHR